MKMSGLIRENGKNGRPRYRVRVEGNPAQKILLTAEPTDSDFMNQYWDARGGLAPQRPAGALVDEQPDPSDVWKGSISTMLKGARYRSTVSGLQFDLKPSDLSKMINMQGGRCALSGIPFSLHGSITRRPFVPSIDRIDNAKGYLLKNVRLTCAIVNTARADWSEKSFLMMCAAVVAKAVADRNLFQEA